MAKDTLFVSNFPYHYEELDLENLFKDCGKVLGVRIPEDRMTRKSKGFAFVTMESERAARKALNYDGHKVMNRPLKVKLAESKVEPVFRQEVKESVKREDKVERRRSRSRSDSARRKHRSKKRNSSSSERHHRHHKRLNRKQYKEDRNRISSSDSESSGFDEN